MLKMNICKDVNKYIYFNKVLIKVFTTFAGKCKDTWQKRLIITISS